MIKNSILALGWIVSLGLGAALYGEWQTVHQLNAKIQTTQEELDKTKAEAAALVDMEERYETLKSTVAQLEETVKTTKESATTLREEFPVPDAVNPTALLKRMLGAAEGHDEDVSDDERADEEENSHPFATMFEGEAMEQMMRVGAKTALTTQYHDLFTTLNLPPERADALREVLHAHLEAEAMAGLAVMRGESSEEAVAGPSVDLETAVAEVLTPEEMVLFEQHEAEMPARLLQQQFDMQIGMMTPGMKAETRQYTVDVLVEHMLADPEDHLNPSSMTSDLSDVRARYDAAAVQLEAELAPEDMAQVQGFLEQLNLGLDMAASMMEQIDTDTPEQTE